MKWCGVCSNPWIIKDCFRRWTAYHLGTYHRLHLPVNAPVQNMFSHDVKCLSFRCKTLKFSRPNVKCSGLTNFETAPQSSLNFQERVILRKFFHLIRQSLKVVRLSDSFFLSCWLESSSLWAVSKSKTSQLGGKTWKFDTWNSDVWRHVKTCFTRVRSRVDAIDGSV